MHGAAIFSDMNAFVVAARELHLVERPHADLDLDLLAVVIHGGTTSVSLREPTQERQGDGAA